MDKVSGGLVLYRKNPKDHSLLVLVAHPGGPYFKNKDDGWWTIPKGEPNPQEDIFLAALREFEEETGMKPSGPFIDLGSIIQNNGKKVFAWAFEGNWPDDRIPDCNEISMEYPKGSGKIWKFPEIDRVEFLPVEKAKQKLRGQQVPFLDRLVQRIPQTKTSRSS